MTAMNIRELLQTLLVWGLYPVWLLAGAGVIAALFTGERQEARA